MRRTRDFDETGGTIVTADVQFRRWGVAAFAFTVLRIGTAHADLTASYDGTLTVKRSPAASVAGVLTQAASAVAGTVAISGNPAMDGIYTLTGQRRGSRISLLGVSNTGIRMKLSGKVSDESSFSAVARTKGPAGKSRGVLAFSRRAPEPPPEPREHCDSSFFTTDVMQRVLVPVCANCHTAGGVAQATAFRVTAGDLLATQDSVASQIDLHDSAASRLLLKPLNQLAHGGGQQLQDGSTEFETLRRWAELVATNQQCNAGTESVETVPLNPAELLVRASMDLRGLRPAPAELAAVEQDPAQYEAMIDTYLHSDLFLERVKDVFDEALLVRREDDNDERRDETAALYGEALELISYIVRTDRPFTEVGTADYTVANELFQNNRRMNYPMEPVTGAAWQPTHYLDGRPHAGLLSTSAFYQVWDTNNTNVNRRRANRWSIVYHCYNFLDTPVDVTRNVDNNDAGAVLTAVTSRADCKACHERLDPLASFLFPTDSAGIEDSDPRDFFRGDPERWRRVNRRAPGVYGRPGMDLRDMGRLLVENERFAQCQTRRAFRLLTGRLPQSSAELSTADRLSQEWRTTDNYNFRTLVRRWMTADVYRTRPKTDNAKWVRRASPERLESLIFDTTGFLWTRPPDNDEDDNNPESRPNRMTPVPVLTNEERGLKIILGGINGVTVSARSHDLNATTAVVQRKVATLAAEFVLANDLLLPDGSRKLLNGVSGTETPGDEAAVRAAIVQMARRLYGLAWTADGDATTVLFTLFRNLHDDRTQGGTGQNQVPGTASQRAWRGVLIAMLRSPRMLLS
jgi:hypothetical protein